MENVPSVFRLTIIYQHDQNVGHRSQNFRLCLIIIRQIEKIPKFCETLIIREYLNLPAGMNESFHAIIA